MKNTITKGSNIMLRKIIRIKKQGVYGVEFDSIVELLGQEYYNGKIGSEKGKHVFTGRYVYRVLLNLDTKANFKGKVNHTYACRKKDFSNETLTYLQKKKIKAFI